MPDLKRRLTDLARRLADPGPEAQSGGAGEVSRPRLLLVLATALAVRLVYFRHIADTPLATRFVPDLDPYLFYAERLLDGSFFFQVPLLTSPGYPLFLAPLVLLFGENPAVLVLANLLLDALSAVLVCLVANRLYRAVTAFDAGMGYALCGPAFFYAGLPLGEGPAVFFALAATLSLLDAVRREGAFSGSLAGVCLGLACLMRPNLFLVFPVWVLLAAVRRLRDGDRLPLRAVGRCGLGLALALAPFAAHNLVLEDSPAPFGFQGGYSFYSGNHAGSSGSNDAVAGISTTPFVTIVQSRELASRLSGRELGFAGSSGFWYARGLAFFRERPAEAFPLLGRKALLALNQAPPDAAMDYDYCRKFSFLLDFLDLPAGPVLGLGLLGVCLPGRRREGFGLVEAFFLAGLSSVVLFTVQPRFLAPVVPLALPFASHVFTWLTDRLRERRWRAALLAGLCGGVLVGLSFIPPEALTRRPSLRDLDAVRFTRYYFRSGDYAKAGEESAQELARSPGNAALRWLRGLALLALGEREAALPELVRAAAEDPEVARPERWFAGGR